MILTAKNVMPKNVKKSEPCDILSPCLNIIEHRGGWYESPNTVQSQNTAAAFLNSFKRKNGIEFDVRDMSGDLVISHDTPNGIEMTLTELILLYQQHGHNSFLSINIKSSGLAKKLKMVLQRFSISNYFVFDLAIPDLIEYRKEGLNYFLRESDLEKDPAIALPYLYKNATGIWLDQFLKSDHYASWITVKTFKKHLDNNMKIVIVSPELHPWGRDEKILHAAWQHYKSAITELSLDCTTPDISLCTDFPVEANLFFNG